MSFLIYVLVAIAVAEIFYFDDQYKTYYHIFYFPSMYFALVLFTFVFAAVDRIILALRRQRKNIKNQKLDNAERARQEKDIMQGRTVTRRVTVYKRKYLHPTSNSSFRFDP